MRLADLNWRELKVIAKFSPPGAAFHQVIADAETQWPRTDQLLAAAVDAVNYLAWVYVSAHTEQSPPRPQLVPRPGVVQSASEGTKHFGSDPIPASDFNDWWQGGGG